MTGDKKLYVSLMLLFTTGFFYSLLIAFGDHIVTDVLGTISFLSAMIGLFLYLGARAESSVLANALIISLATLSIPLGIALGATLAGKAESFFWVADSTSTHLPGALNVANWITNGAPLSFTGPLQSRGLITHLWVGFFIAVLGTHAWVTVLALGVLKIPTCCLIVKIYQELFGTKQFAPAFVIYLIAPTVLWHTLAFYKEAAVHLSISLTFYGLVSLNERVSIWKFAALTVGVIFLAYERFYLVALVLPLVAIYVLVALKARRLYSMIAIAAGAIGFYWVYPYFKLSPTEALAHLRNLREAHGKFPDINYTMNYEIPYFVAAVKSFLTPIWSPEKLTMFRGPIAMLTWGSFVHQVIILSYFLGVFRAVRSRGLIHLAIQVPFFLFILALAYVSPWAGRIRDSFYPLIAVYAFFYWKSYLMGDLRQVLKLLRLRRPTT